MKYWSGKNTFGAPVTLLSDLTVNGNVNLANGTAAAPSLTFTSDPDTGLFSFGAFNRIGMSLGGTQYVDFGVSRVTLGTSTSLQWDDTGTLDSISADLFLLRDAAASLQMGADAASPVNQKLKGPDATAGDTAGGSLTLQGGTPFGAGAYGALNLQSSGGNVAVGGAAAAAEMRFLEPSGSGTNYTGFKAPALAGNTIYTLPIAFPTTGYLLSSTDAGVLSWVAPGAGEMVYPGAGIALSTGTSWGTSITNNSTNWNTAYGWGDHASAGYVSGPAGADTQLQVNNAGAFGASANLTWDGSLNITNTGAWATGFTLTGGTAATSIAWTIANDNNYVWTQGVYGSAGGGPNNSFYIYNVALDWVPININPATESISFDAAGDFGGALTGTVYVNSTNAATYTVGTVAKETRRGILTTQQSVTYTLPNATVGMTTSFIVPTGDYQIIVDCDSGGTADKFVDTTGATNTRATLAGTQGTSLSLLCVEANYWTVVGTQGTVTLSTP